MRSGCCLLLVASLCAFIAAPITAQEKAEQPMQGFTGYPPSVYMHPFLTCVSDGPCAQTDKFHLDQVPTGCCVLIVTNGDGQRDGRSTQLRGFSERRARRPYRSFTKYSSSRETPGYQHAQGSSERRSPLQGVRSVCLRPTSVKVSGPMIGVVSPLHSITNGQNV